MSSMSHNLTDDDLKTIADKAHGFVGADLAAVCKEGDSQLSNLVSVC